MERLFVDLKDTNYPIVIDAGILSCLHAPDFFPQDASAFVVLTSEAVATHYLSSIQQCFPSDIVHVISVPNGESAKTFEVYARVITQMLEKGIDRSAVIVALGGGTVGDLAGFVAATYQRGVRFIQIPTTLLAQVDSSVGGKTGINHALGKNMIGAFYQPQAVVIDTQCLHTLPQREFLAGLAEVIKYGVIWDPNFFVWLEQNINALLALEQYALIYAISKCCQIKAAVVAQDEHEQNLRQILNFGHTFGHAIETGMGYGTYLHGEAVAIGMNLAGRCACSRGLWAETDYLRLRSLLLTTGLPIQPPTTLKPDQFVDLMQKDKKNRHGQLHLVLPVKLGAVEVVTNTPHDLIVQTIEMEQHFEQNDSSGVSDASTTA